MLTIILIAPVIFPAFDVVFFLLLQNIHGTQQGCIKLPQNTTTNKITKLVSTMNSTYQL